MKNSANNKIIIGSGMLALILLTSLAHAAGLDPLALIKRDLANEIGVISETEIRYCPDNTCDVFKIAHANNDFAAFIYLHLFHESDYIYLKESFGDQKAFRDLAKEEPIVRKSVQDYCPDTPKTPECILEHMRKKLSISKCFGRFDEGQFCTTCDEETTCEKL